jgi:hypothetical protein
MPSPTYAQNKKHYYKWMEKNLEKKKACDKRHQIKRGEWMKIQRMYLRILL